MIKKKSEAVIKTREEDRKRDEWFDKRKIYRVMVGKDEIEPVMADSYIIGGNLDQQFLIFFVRLGDELVETARFREWISVSIDMDCLYKHKNP